MTLTCYEPLLQPDFFFNNGECVGILHDLELVGGDLKHIAEAAVSALIIQLGTDKVQAGQRGFWGDEFVGFNLGNHGWTLTNNVNGETNSLRVRADEYIREALEELVRFEFFDDFTIRTVEVVDGFELNVNILRDGVSLVQFAVNT